MDLIKSLKKKTESKIADLKSDFLVPPAPPSVKPAFDYNALNVSLETGPLIVEDVYGDSDDFRNFIIAFNKMYPTHNSHEPGYFEMQVDSVIRLRKMLLSLPVTDHTGAGSQPKWFKMYSHSPVKDISLEEIYFLNERTLFRFLRSHEYKVEKTYNVLLKTLAWRRFRMPFYITPQTVWPVLRGNMIYRRGYDYYGCPILYFKPINEVLVDLQLEVMAIFFMLERGLQTCLPSMGNDKVYVIVDLKDWSLSKLPPMDLMIETVRALVDHYTETIDEIVFVDPPPLIDPVYQVVKCVVPASTAKKILIKHRSQKLYDHFRDRVPLCFLETQFGGTCDPSLNNEVYWKYEESQYQAFHTHMKEWVAKNKNKFMKRDDSL